jgi:hypothetical protein
MEPQMNADERRLKKSTFFPSICVHLCSSAVDTLFSLEQIGDAEW